MDFKIRINITASREGSYTCTCSVCKDGPESVWRAYLAGNSFEDDRLQETCAPVASQDARGIFPDDKGIDGSNSEQRCNVEDTTTDRELQRRDCEKGETPDEEKEET